MPAPYFLYPAIFDDDDGLTNRTSLRVGDQVPGNDGLCFGECRLMVDESINVHPGFPRSSVLYLYPDDVRGYHRQLSDDGLAPPGLEESFYGMVEFRMEDPDGNRLWIGQDTSTPIG